MAFGDWELGFGWGNFTVFGAQDFARHGLHFFLWGFLGDAGRSLVSW
jgi:hypothetical protein